MAVVFAEVVSGRRAEAKQVLARAPSRQILVLGAAWLEEIEAELSKSTRDQYEMYFGSHFGPYFKTIDRVTSESAMDYRRARLKSVQRISLLKELSRMRGFMAWCKTKKYTTAKYVYAANYAVRKGGVEPPHPCGYRNLNPARLPVPPLSLTYRRVFRGNPCARCRVVPHRGGGRQANPAATGSTAAVVTTKAAGLM